MSRTECICGGEVLAAFADRNYIAHCTECGLAHLVHPDADFDAGGWHDRTTVSALLALPSNVKALAFDRNDDLRWESIRDYEQLAREGQ